MNLLAAEFDQVVVRSKKRCGAAGKDNLGPFDLDHLAISQLHHKGLKGLFAKELPQRVLKLRNIHIFIVSGPSAENK